MKKSTIWAIAIIMGFSFLALLFLQFSYVEEMVKMKKEQFDESVNRSLYQVSRNMEMRHSDIWKKMSTRLSAEPSRKTL